MTDLTRFQMDLHGWRMYNFPDCTPEDQFMGMVEEMGELAHAMLKSKQGIRGIEDADEQIKDAIGDLTIYMMGLCSLVGWDFTTIAASTANEVMRRNWVKYPKDGATA